MSIEKQYHYDPYGEVVYESAGSSINKYKYSGKEWDANQKAYDFGARMQMPSYARFTTMGPLCEKYYSISPYAYCAGNPVNLVDPEGKDIGVLSLEGQHMALLIEQEDNKWAYYSINGDNVYSSGSHIGGRPYNDLGEKVFESPEAFLNSEFNRDDGSNGKENRDIANYNYTSVYVISTDDNHEQDTIIADEIKRIDSEESYSLFKPNHCATAVQRSLLKAGIETRAPYVVTSPVGGVVSQGMAFPYTPHSAYNQIKFNNSGREIKK